ncbi:MAG: cytidylate kinase family protein [Deltaproteobacteria bacterium]
MPIITISRQEGSYGDVIAAILARNMGLELITRQKVHEIAQSCDPEYSEACVDYESEHGPGFFERIFFDKTSYTSLFQSLTYEQAGKGNVIIIGRGAPVVLQDIPSVFKLCVVAPRKVRVERVKARYNLSTARAEEYVRKHDHERTSLETSVFGRDPGDWSLYDIIINTAHYDSGSAAEVVQCAVEKKVTHEEEAQFLEKLKNMGFAKRIETIIRRKLTPVVARNVEVEAESEGEVTLKGSIRSIQDKEKTQKIAQECPGVTSVKNELKILEVAWI